MASPIITRAAVDLGSNSTRLLIGTVMPDGRVLADVRTSVVTRMADGLEQSRVISHEARGRVMAALDRYAAVITQHGITDTTAVLTSAARDAGNGVQLAADITSSYGWNAQVIDGEDEARLTYLGATGGSQDDNRPTAVIDIGGGSTEFVVGQHGRVLAAVSTQVGVVRHGERHLHTDPPQPDALAAMIADIEPAYAAAAATLASYRPERVIGVAGTATQSAGIDLALPEHDPSQVQGHQLTVATLDLLLARVASVSLAQRQSIVGLHPDRAPTIVPGIAMLARAVRALGHERLTVSDEDILEGVLRDRARNTALHDEASGS